MTALVATGMVSQRDASRLPRTLTLVSSAFWLPSRRKLRELEASDHFPRTLVFEQVLRSDILDENFIRGIRGPSRFVYKILPIWLAQVLRAYRIMNRYDTVMTWAPRLTIPFALLLKVTDKRPVHIALLSWISRPKKALFIKLVHTHIDRIVLWSSTQARYAIQTLRIPEQKVVLLGRRVDHLFWRPIPTSDDTICSAGQEMRDYPTLIEAMKGLNIRCHIATGALSGRLFKTVKAIDSLRPLPENVTVGKLDLVDLRDLYARSRFVVVPLLETDTDNGSCVIQEAMAMGKAVICSRTMGQVDLVEEGVTGMYVPRGDARALRAAIEFLWNNPREAKQMGENARKKITRHHTIDRFANDVRFVVEQVMNERRLPGQLQISFSGL